MTAKHTPGPLFVSQPENYITKVFIVDAAGAIVASEDRAAFSTKSKTVADIMAGYSMGKGVAAAVEANERQLADMRLRAAGPELLDAVDVVLKSFGYAPGAGPDWYESCRDSAAKARGES